MIFGMSARLAGIVGLARLAHAEFMEIAGTREVQSSKPCQAKNRAVLRLTRPIVSHVSNQIRSASLPHRPYRGDEVRRSVGVAFVGNQVHADLALTGYTTSARRA